MSAVRAQGNLFTVSAPSGAGKTSLVKALLARMNNLLASVSHTTRPSRAGEQEGVDYYFVSEAKFRDMIDAAAFLEHAEVFGHLYGTSEQAVQDHLHAGQDVILEIDWQGAQQTRKQVPATLSIFILPPSKAALEERLRGRGQDSTATIKRRMNAAIAEMSHYADADYLVINDDFERALDQLAAIIIAARHTGLRQAQEHRELISELLADA